MNLSQSIVLASALLWWPCIGQAQPNRDLYDLQERCRKQAEERFQQTFVQRVLETDRYRSSFNFENHYSLRLNKCFYLVTNDIFLKSSDQSGKSMWLHDVNDNTPYQYYGEYTHQLGLLRLCEVTASNAVLRKNGESR